MDLLANDVSLYIWGRGKKKEGKRERMDVFNTYQDGKRGTRSIKSQLSCTIPIRHNSTAEQIVQQSRRREDSNSRPDDSTFMALKTEKAKVYQEK
mmetsp:Transcript_20278/g.51879  ORF Transcript_20278/g.51879 Transcript_20278/m.51879 type:complete len:95 (-) Transcript_20278:9-293(-)